MSDDLDRDFAEVFGDKRSSAPVQTKVDPKDFQTNRLTYVTDANGVQHPFPATIDGRPKIDTPALLDDFIKCGGDPYALPNASPNDAYKPDITGTKELNGQLLQAAIRKSQEAGSDSELRRALDAEELASNQSPVTTPDQERAAIPRNDHEYYQRVRVAAVVADELGFELKELTGVEPLPCTTFVPGPIYPRLGLFPKGMGTVMYSGGLLALERRLMLDKRVRDARRYREQLWAEYEQRQQAERQEALESTPEYRVRQLEKQLAEVLAAKGNAQ